MKTLKVIEMEKKQLEEERQKLEEEKVRSDTYWEIIWELFRTDLIHIWKLFGIFVYKSSDPYLEMIFKLFEKDEKNIFGNCHNDIIGNKRVWGHGVALSCDNCNNRKSNIGLEELLSLLLILLGLILLGPRSLLLA